MTNHCKDKIIKVLNDFDSDGDVQTSLNRWICGFNLFEILGAARAEIRHSCFLAWLMSPSEIHGMGDQFLRELFVRMIKKVANQTKDYSFLSELILDKTTVEVAREYVNPDFGKSVRIDIRVVVRNPKIEAVIVFENKIGAGERESEYVEEDVKSGQLKDYQALIENEFPLDTTKKAFVFLTPDGRLPEDEGDRSIWGVLSYEDVAQSIQNVYTLLRQKGNVPFHGECLFLIENYIICLRRHVVKDLELIKICNELYARHHKAIDCIINTLKGEEDRCVTVARDAINSALHDIASEPNSALIHCVGNFANGKCPTFKTRTLDAYIPLMPDGKSGSWSKNSSIYLYWFEVKYKSGLIGVRLCLEFGGKGLIEGSDVLDRVKVLYKEITGEDFDLIWQAGKKKGKPHIYHQTWNWKIQSGVRFNLDSEDGFGELRSWIKKAVTNAQEKERELLMVMKEKCPRLFP